MYGAAAVIPALPADLGLGAYFLHALVWRLFHSFGLGMLLDAQSKGKWYVRHYLKHYHYRSSEAEKETVVKRATEEAFGNWQVIYNISLVMTYGQYTVHLIAMVLARQADGQFLLLVSPGRRITCHMTGPSAAPCFATFSAR
jgi:hypothetical protein